MTKKLKRVIFKKMDFEDDLRVYVQHEILTYEAIQIHPALLIIGSVAHIYYGPVHIS